MWDMTEETGIWHYASSEELHRKSQLYSNHKHSAGKSRALSKRDCSEKWSDRIQVSWGFFLSLTKFSWCIYQLIVTLNFETYYVLYQKDILIFSKIKNEKECANTQCRKSHQMVKLMSRVVGGIFPLAQYSLAQKAVQEPSSGSSMNQESCE